MKKFFLGLCLSIFPLLYAYAELTPEEVHKKFNQVQAKYEQLIQESKGQRIIAFVGATNSGKSTTLNLLNDIPMQIKHHEFELHNSENHPNHFPIGNDNISKTLIPQFIHNANVNAFMYDFSGWFDTRDPLANMIGTLFAQQIIQNSEACKFIFVIEEGAITTQNGDLFDKTIGSIKSVWKNEYLAKHTGAIITKSREADFNLEMDFLKGKMNPQQSGSLFDTWKNEHLFIISPSSPDILEGHKQAIIQGINDIEFGVPIEIKTDNLYNPLMRQKIRALFDLEHQDIFRKNNELMAQDLEKYNAFDLDSIKNMEEAVERFKVRTNKQADESKFFRTFKELAPDLYNQSKNEFTHAILITVDTEKTKIINKLKEIVHQKESSITELTQSLSMEKERLLEVSERLGLLQTKEIEITQEIQLLKQQLTSKTHELNDRELVIQELRNEVEHLNNTRLTAKRI